jgi:hypothetical protein
MVDHTAELLGRPGRPLFCPHRSAAFNQCHKNTAAGQILVHLWLDARISFCNLPNSSSTCRFT